jgi:hypothetical protein
MKHAWLIFVVMIVLGMTLVGTAGAQVNAPAGAVGTAFTYQGQIERNGALFTGTCDLQFSLWNDAAAGTQQGTTLSVNAVPVNNGVFAVESDFGNQFKGGARWLQTAAKCADDADFTTLPRVALNPAPYAIGLMPGAQIEGAIAGTSGILRASNNGEGAALVGLATSTTGTTYGVLGNASSPNGYAVWGYSNNNATAVRGFAADGGRGVWGSSLTWQGIFGESRDNVGVVGTSTNFIGVWGETTADNNTGVVGWAKDPCPAGSQASCYLIHPRNSAGVTGHALAKGAGVLGQSAEGNGVYGEAQTDGYGVQGHSTSGVSVAGFSTNYDKSDLNSYGFGTPAAMFGGPNGVIGYSKTNGGNGVSGVGTTAGSVGVQGYNLNGGVAVKGAATNGGTGVRGQSDSGTGVYGQSDSVVGVWGTSNSGSGVMGSSTSGYAMEALGHVTQDRFSSGWVKAMLYVDYRLPAGQQIVRCFNSQLPASAATTPPCGFTVTSPQLGYWNVDFGFNVGTRFVQATPVSETDGYCFISDCESYVLELRPVGGNYAGVTISYNNSGNQTNAPFTMIVF